MTLDDACVALSTKTHLSPGDWADFLQCSPAQQALIAKTYRDQSWTQSADTLGEVLAILAVIGTVAGVVSGVAGAAGAIAALKNI